MVTESFPWEQIGESHRRRYMLDYSFEELAALFRDWGYKDAHAKTVFSGLHRKCYRSVDEFRSGLLPRTLIARMKSPEAPPFEVFRSIQAFPSGDGSVKYLYELQEGGRIESVYMPFENRTTFCISSQMGCALGCTFCATGAMGFRKHLTPGEILGQVLHMRRSHPDPPGQTYRTNVVFMGMGEPLHNLNNVMHAFDSLTDPHGLVLSQRDVSVSTSGLVPKIQQLAGFDRRPQLMVSIAATSDEARSNIMPVNRAYPLEKLLATLERYPLRKNERIMLSYVLIAGVNDSRDDADRLIAMGRRFPSMVNLIPLNEHESSPDLNEPGEARLQWFFNYLNEHGAFATIRRSRGRDVVAACGQLSNQQLAV